MDGQHHEPDTRFSELCIVSDIFPSVIYSMGRVLLEKLTGVELVKKFTQFYGILMFITAVKSAHHLSLF
jgi:hypothetical protein